LDHSRDRPYAKKVLKHGGPRRGKKKNGKGGNKYKPIDDRTDATAAPAAAKGRGGWNKESSKAKNSPYFTHQCDMDRRDVRTLSPEQFIEQYASLGKPVILFSSYNATNDADAANDDSDGRHDAGASDLITGPAWQRWARTAFEKKYGAKRIQVVASSDVAQRRGGFTQKGELTGETKEDTAMPVSEYVASFYDETVQTNPLYFFKRIEKHFPELFGDLDPNRYFADREYFSYGTQQRKESNLFCLGGANSSTFWHSHTNAYRALLYGTTRWFMSPTEDVGRVYRGQSMLDWVDAGYSTLQVQPLECVQRAGEVAYSSTHAVLYAYTVHCTYALLIS
jgi:hypothetical protein